MIDNASQTTPARSYIRALGDMTGQELPIPSKLYTLKIGATEAQLFTTDLDCLHINMIRTHEKLRNKGYARFAIEELATQADLYEVKLTLDCNFANLRACFEHYGFQPTGEYSMERRPAGQISGQAKPKDLYPA